MSADTKNTEKDTSLSQNQKQNSKKVTSVFSRDKDKSNIIKPKGKKEE